MTRKEATTDFLLGAYPSARRLLRRALALLDGVTSPPASDQRARITALFGMIAIREGRPAEAAQWCRQAIRDGEAVRAEKALAHALFGLDLANAALGVGGSSANSERALRIYDRHGDLSRKAGVLNNLGVLAYYGGRWDEALERYRGALEAWEAAGDRSSVSMAAFNIGEILLAQGKLDEAEPLLRDAARASQASGGATDVAETALELARLDARRGETDRALEALEAARQTFVEAGEEQLALLAEARIAESRLLAGLADDALVCATAALEAAEASAESGALVRPTLLRVIGEAQQLLGHASEARRVLIDALSAADEVDYRYESALALDALARLQGEDAGDFQPRRDALFAELGIVALPAT
jgi:tetratricopeptide (TPR) repeat protein